MNPNQDMLFNERISSLEAKIDDVKNEVQVGALDENRTCRSKVVKAPQLWRKNKNEITRTAASQMAVSELMEDVAKVSELDDVLRELNTKASQVGWQPRLSYWPCCSRLLDSMERVRKAFSIFEALNRGMHTQHVVCIPQGQCTVWTNSKKRQRAVPPRALAAPPLTLPFFMLSSSFILHPETG